MEFTYLRLKHFKRFPLRETEVSEFHFDDKLISITGPNGAGKSSLFNELTPLPADKNNFYKNGEKEIHFNHKGQKYVLISDFSVPGGRFSFLIDGEEQNSPGNITTQKELAEKYTSITPIIHDLLTGSESFTSMSLLGRKKLFSSITHMNIDRILENYNNLKEELKNNELLLKSTTSHLTSVEEKVGNKDHVEQLKETLSRTRDFIDFLLNFRTELHQHKTEHNLDTIANKVASLKEKLHAICQRYYIQISAYPYQNLQEYKAKYQSDLALIQYKLDTRYELLSSKEQEMKAISETKLLDIASLGSRIDELKKLKDKYLKDLSLMTYDEVLLPKMREDIYRLEISLPEMLSEFPDNVLRVHTPDQYNFLLDRKKTLLLEMERLVREELDLTKEVEHLEKHKDTILCPSCNHLWSPTDSSNTIIKHKKQLTEILKAKHTCRADIEHNEQSINESISYFNKYKQISLLQKNTESLTVFWGKINKDLLIHDNPSAILPLLRKLILEGNYCLQVFEINNEINETQKKFDLLVSLKDVDAEELGKEIEEITEYIYDKQTKKGELQIALSTIAKMETLYTHVRSLEEAIATSSDELIRHNLSYTITNVIDNIDNALAKNKITLIEIEKELHQHDSLQLVIDRYTHQITDIQTNIRLLNIILDELSPKSGLIAKSVSSFLNIIISNINMTIGNIWEYKMVLKPINVETDVLNYKFKVEVEDSLEIADVMLVSVGMREMINLAFRIMLYLLLGLEHYPLFLDEFGSNLDVTHMAKIQELIQRFSASGKFSQIFVITHKNDLSFLRNMTEIEI